MNHDLLKEVPVEGLLRPPTKEEAASALGRFVAEVRSHYGSRLKGIFLFGSRARADHAPESDADVAVILEGTDWVEWIERHALVRLAYVPSLETGLAIQPWPFSEQQWNEPDGKSTRLVASARRDAIPLKPG
jgi:predicted nucleotidyltransferase